MAKNPILFDLHRKSMPSPCKEVKKLTKAIDDATTEAALGRVQREYEEFTTRDDVPWGFPRWIYFITCGPGSLSHQTNNSAKALGMWEYYVANRFGKLGISVGSQFQRSILAIEQASWESYNKGGNTADSFDYIKPELKAAPVSRLWGQSIWPRPLFNYSINIERDVDLLDMLAYAAAPRNSDAREEILIPRIETVAASFKKLNEALRGCADDDDTVCNIRNLQSACPSLQESSIICPSSRLHTSRRPSAS